MDIKSKIYVSILIPLYNGVEFLDECLESINNQTYKNYEVIIGINGHKENSKVYEKALKHKTRKINIIEYLTVNGKSQTLNKMVKDSKYDIICLLDVDDKWHPKKLEEQIKIKKNYDVVGTFCQYFGDRDDIPHIPKNEVNYNYFLYVNPIINSSCMLNKKNCIWNESITWGLEDYELWLRLNYEKNKFFNIPKVLTYHRIHKTSYFNNDNHNYVESLRNEWKKIYKL